MVARRGSRSIVARRASLGIRILGPLSFGAVLNPVNSTMIATALLPIGRDLGVDAGRTASLVSSMYLASAISQPLAGRLADTVGAKRVFVSGSLLVAFGGILGAVSPAIYCLLASRVIIGLGTGAVYPAAVVIIQEQSKGADASASAQALRLLNTTALVSLALGPLLGGILVDTVGWRATFGINAPLALILAILAWRCLPVSPPRPRTVSICRSLDLPGVALFAVTIVTTQVFGVAG